MNNLYYILTINKNDLPELVNSMSDEVKIMFVQKINTIRWNNIKTKCLVKLKIGLKDAPEVIKHLTPFTHKEILIELQTPEWSKKDII